MQIAQTCYCSMFLIHALWFIRVFSKYPVLGTLIFSTEFQYSKPLINPYSFSITNYFWMAMHIFKLLDLHSRVYLKHFPLISTLCRNSWMFLFKIGLIVIFKPFYHSHPVLVTLDFSRNPVLGTKNPFKPNPYKP